MKISRLIRELEDAKALHGDIDVYVNDDAADPESASEVEVYRDCFKDGEKVIRIIA